MASTSRQALDTLIRNRRDLISLVQSKGAKNTKTLLESAQRDLQVRLKQATGLRGLGNETFTVSQLRATLAQVRDVLATVTEGMKGDLLTLGTEAAGGATAHTTKYLASVDKAFRGAGVQPLALNSARMFEAADFGVRASILRRLASSGTSAAKATEVASPHPAKMGVLQRYGVEGIKTFEKRLQVGLVARKSWAEMRGDLTEESPFLQGQPDFWAQRIVRTEVMGAYNRANWEVTREADKELGDMLKILSATFDDRTAADSYAVHGQIRRPTEAFEWWEGAYQHPPNRPNDREVVTPHRMSWPIPPYLAWKDAGAIAAAWKRDGRKGAPPERPVMTTVPLSQIGQAVAPRRPARPDDEGDAG